METGSATFTFTGIGTSWCILTDDVPLHEHTRESVLDYIRVFNRRFSRFLSDSEVNAYRTARPGEYSISEEFATLLSRADELRRLTEGVYDPAVGALLEQAGYDAVYSMVPQPTTAQFILPKWTIDGCMLTIDGPVVFDLGGMGKGYCIDRVADILEEYGHRQYLVDGGGDMYGTIKQNGEPWRIALEYPGKPDVAAGIVQLENQGIAVSDTFRRRWGRWHHIVHPLLCAPVESVAGAVAIAQTAWAADCATSALFFSREERYPAIAHSFAPRFLVFRDNGSAYVSSDWSDELFL